MSHHPQKILRGIAGDLRALFDQGKSLLGRRLVRALASDLRPADDGAERVCDLVGHAGGEICGSSLGLHACGERALLRSDQECGAASASGDRQDLHTGSRRERRLGSSACALDQPGEVRRLKTTEQLLRTGLQVGRRLAAERLERVHVASHGAALVFFEESQSQLVSNPTNYF